MITTDNFLFTVLRPALWVTGLFSLGLSAQDCALSLSGYVYDAGTTEGLPFASVLLEETQAGTIADDEGRFVFRQLCPGEYHLLVRHVGCEPQRVFITLSGDTSFTVQLRHHTELIDEVVVHGSAADNTTQTSSSVGQEEIFTGGDGNLSGLLEGITGVAALRNGASIGKPIIHGLFGNRITLLNNGIPQSGQQWGVDHAPEIDPFVADHLSVQKGVAALAYDGSGLGGVVRVDPGDIEAEPHLHGTLNYLFATNGRGHTINTRLQKSGRWADWRLTSTLRLQGDNQTPDYFLSNTGRKEGSLAAQFQKDWPSGWNSELYYSFFATELGILRGSHIGNLTDLNAAVGRAQPFFTEPDFHYVIGVPRQAVRHHLLKLQSSRSFTEQQRLTFTYALQLNDRREYDVRRGDRSNRPALSLKQWSHRISSVYSRPLGEFSLLKSGIQLDFTDNENQPGTGVLPLIPDYESLETAVFTTLLRERGNWTTEYGIRYEYVDLLAFPVSRDLPLRLLRLTPNFHNLSAALGGKYRWNRHRKISANLGFTRRSPAINELYSQGLHQGVSGIEEGHPDLRAENAVKGTLTYDWAADNDRFYVQATAFYQYIADYIYLQPQPDFRLTVRGAFPVFLYEQTDATLTGLDLLFSVEPSAAFKVVNTASLLRGQDVRQKIPLVFMPANRVSSSWEYAFGEEKRFSNTEIALRGEYVFRQGRWVEGQDLISPPPGYFLLGFRAKTHLQFAGSFFHLSVRVDNVLNTTYRDYLNRLRYYADELGRNLVVGIKWEF